MARFLDLFPKIAYDINKKKYAYSNYELITNITFRFNFIREILNNTSAYFLYTISDTDTPEILAEKIYDDPELYWVLLYANDRYDPQYDWPMNDRTFQNYLINKYGSIANTQTQIHHYEKVIERTESSSGITTETRFVIDYNNKTNTVIKLTDVNGNFTVGNTIYVSSDNTLPNAAITATVLNWSNTTNEIKLSSLITSGNTQLKYQTLLEANSSVNGVVSEYIVPKIPYDYYLGLPETASVETINTNGRTVIEVIRRDAISIYDYEFNENEKKRLIKIIKPEYIQQIVNEFDNLTGNSISPGYRRFTV